MKPFLQIRDFSVSGEDFQLLHDEEFDMLVTRPQPENLEKYYQSTSYISHTDANKTFTDKLYQAVKKFSLWRKTALIKPYFRKDKTLLDVGAGTGDFLIAARKRGWVVHGIEPSRDARLRSREKKMELLPDIESLTNTRFQVITLWHVLEHLPDFENEILGLKKHLENDGGLIIAVPNFRSYDANHYKEFWAAYDVPRHLWHFSREAIHKIFARSGMKVVKTKPMWFDAFYVSLLSEKYKGSKLPFLKAFFVGLWSNLIGCLTKEYSSIIYIIKKA